MEDSAGLPVTYACPACKQRLEGANGGLRCLRCHTTFPIVDGIADFLGHEFERRDDPVVRTMRVVDRFAALYESRIWYSLVLNLYGGVGSTTLPSLIDFVSRSVGTATGLLLDVACGPGTFGRRLASPSLHVCGVDISWGMLRQGTTYVRRDEITAVEFARASVEALPFEPGMFDAAVCCGALHLFPNPLQALQEIGRTMKEGAPLSVVTFTAGPRGILRSRQVRKWVEARGFRTFEIAQLERLLDAAGFREFKPESHGSVLNFSARKSSACAWETHRPHGVAR